MKAFIFAMLVMGAILLIAALFWPDHAPTPVALRHDFQPVAPSIEHAPPESRQAARVDLSPAATSPPLPSLDRDAPFFVATPKTATSASTNSNRPLEPAPQDPLDQNLTDDERKTLKQTGTDDTSLRNPDFPRTYIKKIHVDLTSPNQWVTLTWAGPQANLHPPTPYHSSPGRGLGNNNCDDPTESCRVDSNCTPKGTMKVQAFSNSMVGSPEVRFVTWFDGKRGIALHYYPNVPFYPASHGCVRLEAYAGQLIHNNSKIGETEVVIDGKWTFAR